MVSGVLLFTERYLGRIMDELELPSSLIFDGNVAEQWKIWRQELELYLTATESDEKDDKVKTSI